MGRLPEALEARRVSLDRNRRADNQLAVPFNLARQAELLARLGRQNEAEAVAATLQREIVTGHEAYVTRRAAIYLTHARVAILKQDWRLVLAHASRAKEFSPPEQTTVQIGASLASALALANLGRDKQAQADAQAALSAAENLKEPRVLLGIRESIVSIFDRSGDARTTYEAAEAALVLSEA